jgi:hypothetical protein
MADGPKGQKKKMEGMPPPWLQPLRPSGNAMGDDGLKPHSETQRFVPGPGSLHGGRHQGLAIEGAWVLLPKGPDRSSRVVEALSFLHPAGAAGSSGHCETLSTLSPPSG